jgi:hypothetical protein
MSSENRNTVPWGKLSEEAVRRLLLEAKASQRKSPGMSTGIPKSLGGAAIGLLGVSTAQLLCSTVSFLI